MGECNDGSLNAIRKRIIGYQETMQAIQNAADGPVPEGSEGAGAGMICHGLKGGIGTASRVLEIGGKTFTVGMLGLCNHGVLEELDILGKKPGKAIKERLDEMCKTDDSGSCILVLATDLPLSSRQLKRVVKRASAGLARCGSYWGHGSGDVTIGFTTAYDLRRKGEQDILQVSVLREKLLDSAFAAAAECAQECVLNALAAAETIRHCHSLSEFRGLLL